MREDLFFNEAIQINLETGLLSKLIESRAVAQVWDAGLRREVFEDPRHAEAFDFVLSYWFREGMHSAPTKDVLTHEFPGLDLLPVDESQTWLTEKLKERYTTNQVQELLRSAARLSTTDPVASLEELYAGAWATKQVTATRGNRVDLAVNVDARRQRYTERVTDHRQLVGAPLGLPEIDVHTRGTLPGEVSLVAAYTKTGKSFMLINSGVKARKGGYTPCAFSLEQPVPEFEDRIDCLASGVGYGRMQHGRLTIPDVDQLHRSQEEMAEYGAFHLERPDRGERTVVNLVNRARQLQADYLIIDQLSWMEPTRVYRDRRDSYKELIYDLKEEVSRPGAEIPCLIAAQYNRQSVASRNERGGMQNIANSADIEQTIDTAFGLWRNRETRANDSMVLDILGARRCDNKAYMLEWRLDNESVIRVREEIEEGILE